MRNFIVLTVFLSIFLHQQISALNSVWRYECVEGYCQKKNITPDTEDTALCLGACRVLCSDSGAIWPKPTGNVSIGKTLVPINPNSLDVEGLRFDTPAFNLARNISNVFKKNIKNLTPEHVAGGKSLVVTLDVKNPKIQSLTLETDESYSLSVSEASDGRMEAVVSADNIFGARHGLETLSQLIIIDDLRDELTMPKDVSITDKPAYPYRGILLDTARNYVSVRTIKKTLDGMGLSKMNTFHWHITDSHSFPFVSKTQPDLSKYGAYSPKKIYTACDIEDLISYGKERGVRVMPEFDAPAHVGEGWQNTDLVTCSNWQPWQDYCVEPPCGQFNPTKAQLYDVLEDIYGDMIEQFNPDIFHMGGDEVNFNCWNSTQDIVDWMAKEQGWGRSEQDFVKLWDYFQKQALERLYKKAGKEIPAIMWTSHLTQKEYIQQYLPKDKYIIQIWTTGDDQQIKDLIDGGYRLILSNYDVLYLDCGFSGWVTDGNNWCSPYHGWQKVYENKIEKIAGDKKNQFLGAEATLWTEQVDSTVVDSRLWPRAAALAEVLWTEPTTPWRDAEQRMLVQRDRLVNLGIDADGMEPEWCMQYEENCPIGGHFNKPNQ